MRVMGRDDASRFTFFDERRLHLVGTWAGFVFHGSLQRR